MSEFRRLKTQRVRPEVFGLSTLDTVTCALGGAIVLMIMMAALTERKATINLFGERRILESGSIEGSTPAARGSSVTSGESRDLENLAVIFYSVGTSRGIEPDFSAPNCEQARISARTLRSPDEHFDDDPTGQPVAYTIWALGDANDCNRFILRAPVGSESCEVTIASGAHYETHGFPRCDRPIIFQSNGDKVYRFQREF